MTVRELYNWCRAYPHKDAQVYLVKDWDDFDEDGIQNDLYKLRGIIDQTIIVDTGLGFIDQYEVLLDVAEERED